MQTMIFQQQMAALKNKKTPEQLEAKKEARIAKEQVKTEEGFQQDLTKSKQTATDFMADKRLADQDATTSSRALLEQNMSSSAESMARREQAVRGLQGAEATQNRQLMAQLGSSGLRGGAALGATQDLSIAQQNNRRAMEQDLYLTDQNLDRQARTQLAGFDMDIAKTDLATQTSSELGFLNMAQSNRSAILQREAMMEAARIQASASGGKK